MPPSPTPTACSATYRPTTSPAARMTLDTDASRAAIERDVASPLGIDVVEAAWGIERIVNANMANAMRRVLSSYGADPRDLAVIAYGGNGPLHACALATELGSPRVLVPKTAPAFSALGLLVADYVVDLVRSYVVPISQVDVARLTALDARARRRDREGARARGPRSGRGRHGVVRADGVQRAELRHERAGTGGDEPRRERVARSGPTVPRPARVRPRVRVPQPAAAGAGRPADGAGRHREAEPPRRDGIGHRRRVGPQAVAARCTGVRSTSPRRCTTATCSVQALPSRARRSSRSRSPSWPWRRGGHARSARTRRTSCIRPPAEAPCPRSCTSTSSASSAPRSIG